MNKKFVVVDDDPLTTMVVCQYAARLGGLELLRAFNHEAQARAYLKEHPTDLLLLDVELGNSSGFDLLHQLPYKPEVVIISAQTKYAHLAYEYQAFDFLRKPFSFERFREMKEKFDLLQQKSSFQDNHSFTEIFVRTSNEFRRIAFDAICYIQVIDKYLKIVTDTGFLLISGALQEIERRLPPDRFVRTHRSYLVHVRKIDSLTDNAVVIKGQTIPLSRSQRSQLTCRINLM